MWPDFDTAPLGHHNLYVLENKLWFLQNPCTEACGSLSFGLTAAGPDICSQLQPSQQMGQVISLSQHSPKPRLEPLMPCVKPIFCSSGSSFLFKRKHPKPLLAIWLFNLMKNKTKQNIGFTRIVFLPFPQLLQMWPSKQSWYNRRKGSSGWSLAWHLEGDLRLTFPWYWPLERSCSRRMTQTQTYKQAHTASLHKCMKGKTSPVFLITPNLHTRSHEWLHCLPSVSITIVQHSEKCCWFSRGIS